jgi:hypothetical protein
MRSTTSVDRLQRATAATERQTDWPDTQPALHRSEAFFEDLHELQAPAAADRRSAAGVLGGVASLVASRVPLLGVLLAGLLGSGFA